MKIIATRRLRMASSAASLTAVSSMPSAKQTASMERPASVFANRVSQNLAARGIRLDAVLDLEVDEGALLDRIRGRAAEVANQGQPARQDDNPEVFKSRLEVYRAQTAPVTEYYRSQGLPGGKDWGLPLLDRGPTSGAKSVRSHR